MLKKLLHITVSFTLIASLLLGYTGIPVYKMACRHGSTKVSVLQLKDDCKHETEADPHNRKSCCKPVAQTTPGCCDFSSDFLQLHELVIIKETQNSTGHSPLIVPALFQTLVLQPLAPPADHSPAPLTAKAKQPRQSITQNFRI